MRITIVGLDIAKRVFQLHGVDAVGKTVLRQKSTAIGGAGTLQGSITLFGWH